MKDVNQNGIPDKADKLIGLVLIVANIVLGAVALKMDPAPVWVLVALTAVGSLAGLFTVGIIPRPVRSGPTALLVLLGLATMTGGCTHSLVNGYRSYGLAVIAGKSANKVILGTCKAKLGQCQSDHRQSALATATAYAKCRAATTDPKAMLACSIPQAKAQATSLAAYRKCKAGCTSAVKLWVNKIAPSYNAGLVLYWGGLETARIAGSKEYTVPEKARPGLCALIKAPAFFRHLFGKTLAAILEPILLLKGLVCP